MTAAYWPRWGCGEVATHGNWPCVHTHPSHWSNGTVSLPSLISFHDDTVIFIVSIGICPSTSQDKQKDLDKNVFVMLPMLESGDQFLPPNVPSPWGSCKWKCERAGKYWAHTPAGSTVDSSRHSLVPQGVGIYWITEHVSINRDKFMNTMKPHELQVCLPFESEMHYLPISLPGHPEDTGDAQRHYLWYFFLGRKVSEIR